MNDDSGASGSSTSGDDHGSDPGTDSDGPPGRDGGDDEGSEDGSGGSLFDVAAGDDRGEGDCPEAVLQTPSLGHLWVANLDEGTVSKIDVETVSEVGRYITRPDGAGEPWNVSVSSFGDPAITNYLGGVTKLYADPEDCEESNGEAGLQTSEGDEPLAWGTEECVAWHTPTELDSQMVVAWAPATGAVRCEDPGRERLWVAGNLHEVPGSSVVYRLDGESGEIVDEVEIPDIAINCYGPYTGASDGSGNLWMGTTWPEVELLRIDAGDLSVERWDVPDPDPLAVYIDYGLTVDGNGRPWICNEGVARFDPVTETFDLLGPDELGIQGASSCMADDAGHMWTAGLIRALDVDTMELVNAFEVGAGAVAVDFEGHVWAIANGRVTRIDPTTGATQTYEGLGTTATKSDMTGFALAHAG